MALDELWGWQARREGSQGTARIGQRDASAPAPLRQGPPAAPEQPMEVVESTAGTTVIEQIRDAMRRRWRGEA
jgi:hypothetical protein